VSGYICKLIIYDASGMALQETVSEHVYIVYMDSYYNCVHVAKQLHEQNTGVCETVRQNICIPSDLKNHQNNLKKDERTFWRDGDVLLLSWMDKRVISIIFGVPLAEMVEVSNRFGKKQIHLGCVADYNTFMHVVVNADQYLTPYPFMRKTAKWPKIAAMCVVQFIPFLP
jgi:hypothetical protein